jgi:3',5'-cyclic AMP phosphodiesterase CpdA
MRLLGLSDLHVRHRRNREAIERIRSRPDDWLILAGDLGEEVEQIQWVIDTLGPRFARLLWVPGNHELWSRKPGEPRGEAKYQALVDTCRAAGVLTPEDPWVTWEGPGGPLVIALLFLLYDYSFRPDDVERKDALRWAGKSGVLCTDEFHLKADPHPSREAWCHARVEASMQRLDALPDEARTILVNHWPLRQDLVRLPRIPRFSLWCGTTLTEDWHTRYRADIVVSGHLHMRATDWRDGTRFEEISLGYPPHYRGDTADRYIREILPGRDDQPRGGTGGPLWIR